MRKSISNLEQELRFQIFTHNRKGMALTVDGKYIMKKVGIVLTAIGDFKEEANRCTKTLGGELKIGIIPGPINLLIDMVSGNLQMQIKAFVFEERQAQRLRYTHA